MKIEIILKQIDECIQQVKREIEPLNKEYYNNSLSTLEKEIKYKFNDYRQAIVNYLSVDIKLLSNKEIKARMEELSSSQKEFIFKKCLHSKSA